MYPSTSLALIWLCVNPQTNCGDMDKGEPIWVYLRAQSKVNPTQNQWQTTEEEASQTKFGEIFPEAEEWMLGN